MLKLGRVTKFKMLLVVLVFVFNFDLFKFSAAILEKGLFPESEYSSIPINVHDKIINRHGSKFVSTFALCFVLTGVL